MGNGKYTIGLLLAACIVMIAAIALTWVDISEYGGQATVAAAAKSFVFNTADMLPADLSRYGVFPGDSGTASDHLPVVFDLAIHPPAMPFDGDQDQDVDIADHWLFTDCVDGVDPRPADCLAVFDADSSGALNLRDWGALQAIFGADLCNLP